MLPWRLHSCVFAWLLEKETHVTKPRSEIAKLLNPSRHNWLLWLVPNIPNPVILSLARPPQFPPLIETNDRESTCNMCTSQSNDRCLPTEKWLPIQQVILGITLSTCTHSHFVFYFLLSSFVFVYFKIQIRLQRSTISGIMGMWVSCEPITDKLPRIAYSC